MARRMMLRCVNCPLAHPLTTLLIHSPTHSLNCQSIHPITHVPIRHLPTHPLALLKAEASHKEMLHALIAAPKFSKHCSKMLSAGRVVVMAPRITGLGKREVGLLLKVNRQSASLQVLLLCSKHANRTFLEAAGHTMDTVGGHNSVTLSLPWSCVVCVTNRSIEQARRIAQERFGRAKQMALADTVRALAETLTKPSATGERVAYTSVPMPMCLRFSPEKGDSKAQVQQFSVASLGIKDMDFVLSQVCLRMHVCLCAGAYVLACGCVCA